MQIRVGYELIYRCPKPTPMVVTLSIHYSRVSDVTKPDHLVLTPSIPITAYRDSSQLVQPHRGPVGSCGSAVMRRSDTGTPIW